MVSSGGTRGSETPQVVRGELLDVVWVDLARHDGRAARVPDPRELGTLEPEHVDHDVTDIALPILLQSLIRNNVNRYEKFLSTTDNRIRLPIDLV